MFLDHRPVQVPLPACPQRIVSLVPSQTELLAYLGLDAEVVGLTRFCVHPAGWKKEKTVVGGTKQVNLERLQALAPDLVLANREENTREMAEAIAAFAPVYVTDVRGVDGALSMIRTVGALVGRAAAAERLAGAVAEGFDALAGGPPLRVAYLIWQEPYMTVGHDTFIHDVLARAGLVNVFGDQPRYPEVAPGVLADARPDAVLLASEPFPFTERHLPAFEALVPGARVCLVDGEPLSWYGSRLLHTPAYLHALRDRLSR